MTQKNQTLKERREEKIRDTIACYNYHYKDMKFACKRFYLTAIRSLMPNEMDNYVAEINDIAYEMQLPESRLFAYTLIALKDQIKARKIEWLARKETKTKVRSIDCSEEEYKACVALIKKMRAGK